MNKILKFKIWGDYAHFKKYYTTTSPLSFEFPPPPTIIGMISAIIGLDKNEYLQWFQKKDDYKISLSIINPVNKVRWSQNLIDTKHSFWSIKNRTQIRIEFLKNPAYNIYFYHKDSYIFDKLKKNLETHNSVYSLCLGLSELLANFEFIDEIGLEEIKRNNWIDLHSILPVSRLLDQDSIDFELTREIFKVNYPISMLPDRIVNHREDILFERKGQPIKCRLKEYWHLDNGENLVFF